ncbi:hypothetical protein JX265_010791 [Neoarthrinium moseri]|uniref:Uncharacterized protein n=1 Tax=Neoarthrinium moseri TaxID=1658444 RepID=A0A9Q0AJX9_9PEZI|nr:uncharacterized protein JN550_010643 [Neoarthrinium moseri]KAI1840213.1 hypothetical protein JX266_013580 [Neoarthrinium moseri]KAI1858123.1 hypothetical protein JX265_010791 [Neoarthrinium moseri]KAI1862012.1 hypothetical protein JN550_010643 [Neoarthrinium moseri]
MKSFLQLLSFGLVAVSVSAVPVVEERQDVVYQLSVATKGDAKLDGQKLEIVNAVVGVFKGDHPPAKVYEIKNQQNPKLSELHTSPVGIVDHVLGLKGDNGLYNLVDITNIHSTDNSKTHFSTFKLKDGLVTQDLPGHWIAFPSGNGAWDVKWYDGNAIITQNYVSVDVKYKKSTK